MLQSNAVVTHPYNAQSDKGDQLEEDPRLVVFDVEEDGVLVPEWIYASQDEGRHQGAEKRPPQRFQGEIIADLNKGWRMIRGVTDLCTFFFRKGAA